MLLKRLLSAQVGKVEVQSTKACESNLNDSLLNLVHQETYSNHLGEQAYNLLLCIY